MDEAEWLAYTDSEEMVRFLLHRKASERKVRLFACAVGRRLWGRFKQEALRHAVEFACYS
jgi:hypothetical protein